MHTFEKENLEETSKFLELYFQDSTSSKILYLNIIDIN